MKYFKCLKILRLNFISYFIKLTRIVSTTSLCLDIYVLCCAFCQSHICLSFDFFFGYFGHKYSCIAAPLIMKRGFGLNPFLLQKEVLFVRWYPNTSSCKSLERVVIPTLHQAGSKCITFQEMYACKTNAKKLKCQLLGYFPSKFQQSQVASLDTLKGKILRSRILTLFLSNQTEGDKMCGCINKTTEIINSRKIQFRS